ncbi:MAG TPA: hypothetical protein VJ455_06535, partial [Ignavibacteria bacterium]|nr:hypothetical protein [Ignavibacteria bacterium]
VFNGTNANHFNWELFIVIFFTINILTSAFILYLQKEFLPAIIYMIFINIPFLFVSALCIYDYGLINFLLIIVYIVISSVGILIIAYAVKSKFPVTGIKELKGILKTSRFLVSSAFILLLSISGFPLTFGFTSRLYLFSSINNDFYLLIIIASIISTLISFIILYRFIIALISVNSDILQPIVLNYSQKLILFVSVILTILLGIYPQILTSFLKYIVII